MALRAAVAVKARSQAYAGLARYCSAHGKYGPELIQGSEPKRDFVQVERWDRSTGSRRASPGTGIDLCCKRAGKQQHSRHDETTEKELRASFTKGPFAKEVFHY
jgi:hypothetical protein